MYIPSQERFPRKVIFAKSQAKFKLINFGLFETKSLSLQASWNNYNYNLLRRYPYVKLNPGLLLTTRIDLG
jgi:hypothetical protein